jgi:transmembrane sensor
MEHDSDWERLARYLVGECSPEEAAEIERWAAADPARQESVDQMRTVWAKAEVSPSGWDTAAAWAALDRKLDAGTHAGLPRTHRPLLTGLWPERRPLAWWGLRAAAAVAVVSGAGFLNMTLARRTTQPQSAAPVAMREYVTPRGQRAEFNLSDGTHIVLSVESRLGVPADYDARDRRVYLEGEAYFDVRHNPARRFVVHTGGTITEDLGTRFAVRAYADEHVVQVVVAEGRVALQSTELRQGQLGRLAAAGPVAVKTRVDLDRYLAWTQGRLVFDNTPLRDALPQLGRWYDLDFRLGDSSLATLPVTVTFKNQPTAEVLDLLALTLGVRQERSGRVVTFRPAMPAR